MFREILEKCVNEEVKIHKDKNILAIVVDNMTELQLRGLAEPEIGTTNAWSANIDELVQWYNSYKIGLINNE